MRCSSLSVACCSPASTGSTHGLGHAHEACGAACDRARSYACAHACASGSDRAGACWNEVRCRCHCHCHKDTASAHGAPLHTDVLTACMCLVCRSPRRRRHPGRRSPTRETRPRRRCVLVLDPGTPARASLCIAVHRYASLCIAVQSREARAVSCTAVHPRASTAGCSASGGRAPRPRTAFGRARRDFYGVIQVIFFHESARYTELNSCRFHHAVTLKKSP